LGRRRISLAVALAFCGVVTASGQTSAQEIRVGLIGLDTSHVTAFTELLNDPRNPDHVPGARVVAAFAGGSADIPSSIDRVPQYTATLRDKWGVEVFASIPELIARVDAVMLTSVDGRPHLAQIRPVLAAHKPVFIDKPLAASLADAREIFRLCAESKTPCFSASALRFYPSIAALKPEPKAPDIISVDAYSPATLEPHHPDLYWYGIHGVEILYTLMGPGCAWVERAFSEDQEVTVAQWKDGRMATFRGTRKGDHGYGAMVQTPKGMKLSEPVKGVIYKQLLQEIVKFFQTGAAPVSAAETLEMFAFMDAAQLSRERGGARVTLP
jgi:predicted dehydrogenase